MSAVKLILASHGPLAGAVIESIEMLYGSSEHMYSFQLYADDDIDLFEQAIAAEIKKAETDPIIIITDIPGGTPFNISAKLSAGKETVKVLSGLNVMMVLELMALRPSASLEELVQMALAAGKDSIRLFEAEASQENEELL